MILRMALAGLQFGRSPTMESSPALPVPGADIDAVKLYVSQQVWAMIQLRLATRHVHQTGQEMPTTQMSLHRSHLLQSMRHLIPVERVAGHDNLFAPLGGNSVQAVHYSQGVLNREHSLPAEELLMCRPSSQVFP
jgi:hypothetical protein